MCQIAASKETFLKSQGIELAQSIVSTGPQLFVKANLDTAFLLLNFLVDVRSGANLRSDCPQTSSVSGQRGDTAIRSR